jgi:Zn-dependent peptidase ImmA (M78 family)
MHDWEDADTKQAEQQAHRFAAAFLLPREPIGDVLPRRADWGSLIELKATWGVSIAALLFRSKTLGVMSDQSYLNAVKAMSSRGWRIDEPGDKLLGRPEQPLLLTRAIEVLAQEQITLDDLAEQAALPVALIRRLLGMQDKRTVVDI